MSQGDRPYEVVLTRAAARVVQKLGQKDRDRVIAKLETLRTDPRAKGTEKLTDRGDRYRVRSGDYRIVFSIDDDGRTVDVETIGNRRDVYRE
jgi:mRNA interferase RelE/StbE